MQSHYLFLALDTARARAAEADRNRLAAEARAANAQARIGRVNVVRRTVARLAVFVARAADEGSLRPVASH